jgi:hypothetical protein
LSKSAATKMLFAIAIAIVIIVVIAVAAYYVTRPTPPPEGWSDGRIRIILNEVEKADVIPPDIEDLISTSGEEVPTLGEGQDYVCVNLTIASIEDVHVVNSLGYGDERSTLYDAEGHGYALAYGTVRGIIFTDPHDITSPSEVAEGATAILIFKVPKHEKPTKLTFVYSFKETWEEKSEKRGQIDIIL